MSDVVGSSRLCSQFATAREGVGEGEEEVTRADFCSHAAKRSEPIEIGAIRGIFIRTT